MRSRSNLVKHMIMSASVAERSCSINNFLFLANSRQIFWLRCKVMWALHLFHIYIDYKPRNIFILFVIFSFPKFAHNVKILHLIQKQVDELSISLGVERKKTKIFILIFKFFWIFSLIIARCHSEVVRDFVQSNWTFWSVLASFTMIRSSTHSR